MSWHIATCCCNYITAILDYEQSLFFLLNSWSCGKELQNPALENWGDKKKISEREKFPRAGFRDSFPWRDEFKRKYRDCS